MFCNPNNPTGACATRAQLQSLVDFALANKQIILYDSAYAPFIQDPDKPKTIFEIEGARQCAIESSSLSKLGGFTGARAHANSRHPAFVCIHLRPPPRRPAGSRPPCGAGVRLGWTVVPKELEFPDGSSVAKDWGRIMGTLFNGAANVAQAVRAPPAPAGEDAACAARVVTVASRRARWRR